MKPLIWVSVVLFGLLLIQEARHDQQINDLKTSIAGIHSQQSEQAYQVDRLETATSVANSTAEDAQSSAANAQYSADNADNTASSAESDVETLKENLGQE